MVFLIARKTLKALKLTGEFDLQVIKTAMCGSQIKPGGKYETE